MSGMQSQGLRSLLAHEKPWTTVGSVTVPGTLEGYRSRDRRRHREELVDDVYQAKEEHLFALHAIAIDQHTVKALSRQLARRAVDKT